MPDALPVADSTLTWQRIDTLSEAGFETLAMEHAVAHHFVAAQIRLLDEGAGAKVPEFWSLRDRRGAPAATAMVAPTQTSIVVGWANANPTAAYGAEIDALRRAKDLPEGGLVYPYGSGALVDRLADTTRRNALNLGRTRAMATRQFAPTQRPDPVYLDRDTAWRRLDDREEAVLLGTQWSQPVAQAFALAERQQTAAQDGLYILGQSQPLGGTTPLAAVVVVDGRMGPVMAHGRERRRAHRSAAAALASRLRVAPPALVPCSDAFSKAISAGRSAKPRRQAR